MGSEPALDPHAHALGPLERDHLGGQDMLELAGAAAEGERSQPADRAGMAVGHRMGGAGQHHAELGRHHMGNALLRIVDVEQPDAVAGAALPHGLQERRALRIGGVVRGRAGSRPYDPAPRR